MQHFGQHDGCDTAWTITGPSHVWLGLRLTHERTATFTLLDRSPEHDGGPRVDVNRLRAAIVAGVDSANAITATPVFVSQALYVADDSPRYDLYRECAYLLALRRVTAVRPVVEVSDGAVTVDYATPPNSPFRSSRLAFTAFVTTAAACPCVIGIIAESVAEKFPSLRGPRVPFWCCVSAAAAATTLSTIAAVRILKSGGRLRGQGLVVASLFVSTLWWAFLAALHHLGL